MGKEVEKSEARERSEALMAHPRIGIPYGCRPSKLCAPTSVFRPHLGHGYIHRREDGSDWLCVTNSYAAAALRLEGHSLVREGYVPVTVLKLLERRNPPPVVQVAEHHWRHYDSKHRLIIDHQLDPEFIEREGKFPSFEGPHIDIWNEPPHNPPHDPFGFNPALMAELGAALGGVVLRTSFTSPLRPLHVRHGHPDKAADRVGLIMPMRLS